MRQEIGNQEVGSIDSTEIPGRAYSPEDSQGKLNTVNALEGDTPNIMAAENKEAEINGKPIKKSKKWYKRLRKNTKIFKSRVHENIEVKSDALVKSAIEVKESIITRLQGQIDEYQKKIDKLEKTLKSPLRVLAAKIFEHSKISRTGMVLNLDYIKIEQAKIIKEQKVLRESLEEFKQANNIH